MHRPVVSSKKTENYKENQKSFLKTFWKGHNHPRHLVATGSHAITTHHNTLDLVLLKHFCAEILKVLLQIQMALSFWCMWGQIRASILQLDFDPKLIHILYMFLTLMSTASWLGYECLFRKRQMSFTSHNSNLLHYIIWEGKGLLFIKPLQNKERSCLHAEVYCF